MRYEPTRRSLRQHPVPAWFHDAKLGIFVHWGLYSVPGWAPLGGTLGDVLAREGGTGWFGANPYAEWYLNSIRIPGSPSHHYHAETYGAGFAYDDLVAPFNQAIERWDPDEWADLFQRAGAGYVVLVTKHHDGFLLWPSARPNPWKEGYVARRDVVGELTRAVRARGLRMGLYYSGGLDWTFDETPIRDLADLWATIPQDPAYVEYADHHWRELIARYEPAVLWNDIGYPVAANLKSLFADYYNRVPEGLVNDRFIQTRLGPMLRNPAARRLFSWGARWILTHSDFSLPAGNHWDFRTPEYATYGGIASRKWEATRGLGYSFGYNRNEGPDQMISVAELIRSFVDVVSKNGNLLLNVGPMADGTIPEPQRERVLGLGRWLAVNGEAILDTRPWVRAEGHTAEGVPVRFTQRDGVLYAILLDTPAGDGVTIRSLRVGEGAIVHLLGHEGALRWVQAGPDLTIALPEGLPDSPAVAFRIA